MAPTPDDVSPEEEPPDNDVPPGYPAFPLTSRRRRLPEEGTLEVFVANEQSAQPVDVERWGRLAEQVLAAEGIRGDAELSLLFVDEATIADLNDRFMGHAGPTDVLSFPIDGREDVPEGVPRALGDVVLCPQVVGEEWRWPLTHGLLHLLGYDHGNEMEAREQELLK